MSDRQSISIVITLRHSKTREHLYLKKTVDMPGRPQKGDHIRLHPDRRVERVEAWEWTPLEPDVDARIYTDERIVNADSSEKLRSTKEAQALISDGWS